MIKEEFIKNKKVITVIDQYGREYKKDGRLGQGGQASVWIVSGKNDNKRYACKIYTRVSEKTDLIKKNIIALIEGKFNKDSSGNPVRGFVQPLAFVEADNGSFGYIMELVDLNGYTNLPKAWLKPGMYPTAEALCNIIINISSLFEMLHISAGFCYKDINEGNIFFNPKTGDVKIIDNDNLGPSDIFTIKGTFGYMAPEIILRQNNPDSRTDQFSLAVYIYRLLVGGYPFDGKYTRAYCIKNNLCEVDAASHIYADAACFTFHPTDNSNSIEFIGDKESKLQASLWHNLPKKVKDLFIKTFVTNLSIEKRSMRTAEFEWINVFTDMKKNLVKCFYCGVKNLPGSENCIDCGKKMRSAKYAEFLRLSRDDDNVNIMVWLSDILKGKELSRHLPPKSDIFKLQYNKQTNALGIKNLTNKTWRISPSSKVAFDCPPDGVVTLEPNMKIRIEPSVVQLNVVSINL